MLSTFCTTCITRAVSARRSSSQSRPRRLAVTCRLASAWPCSVTRQPPRLSSGSSSNVTLPRWRMAAMVVYTDIRSPSDMPARYR